MSTLLSDSKKKKSLTAQPPGEKKKFKMGNADPECKLYT